MSSIAQLILQTLIFPGLVFLISLAFFSNWFIRKVYARVQRRVGPSSAGFAGSLQGFADFFKTATKEEIVPDSANRVIFQNLPPIAPVPIVVSLLFIPFVGYSGVISSPGDIYVVIFTLTIISAVEIVLGWASGSNFSLIGASRSGMQLVSFGIPLVFSTLQPIIRAGSFSFEDIVRTQSGNVLGYIPAWNVFSIGFIGFSIYVVCTLAELEKPPFDTPEAETEIAGGWTLEYTGRNYAFILLMDDLKVVLMAAIGVTLFLGGPLGPTFGQDGIVLGLLFFTYFMLKFCVFLLILVIVSSGLARLKISRIVHGTWSLLTPLSIVYIIAILLAGGML